MDSYSIGKLDFVQLDIAVLNPALVIVKHGNCPHFCIHTHDNADFAVKNTLSRVTVGSGVKLARALAT